LQGKRNNMPCEEGKEIDNPFCVQQKQFGNRIAP
jgi:hypothetical protein